MPAPAEPYDRCMLPLPPGGSSGRFATTAGRGAVDRDGPAHRDQRVVVFLDPGKELVDDNSEVLTKTLANLRLPDEDTSSEAPLRSWMEYSGSESRYLKAKSDVINRIFGENNRPTLDLVWRGDGHNPNAALTVFRHFDSASVVQGFVGESPQTAWFIGYPLQRPQQRRSPLR